MNGLVVEVTGQSTHSFFILASAFPLTRPFSELAFSFEILVLVLEALISTKYLASVSDPIVPFTADFPFI